MTSHPLLLALRLIGSSCAAGDGSALEPAGLVASGTAMFDDDTLVYQHRRRDVSLWLIDMPELPW